MATNTETVEEVVLQNPAGTKRYTLFVPTSLRIYTDTGTSAAIYNYLQRIYPVDETGCKKLLLTQSLQVLADLGLLQTWSAMAKGSGVALGKHATFDQLSQAAYSRDVDDDVLGTLGAVAPNHLTAQEKVRFMEIGVAALPKGTPTLEPEMLPIIKKLRTSRCCNTEAPSTSSAPPPRASSTPPAHSTSSAPTPRASSTPPAHRTTISAEDHAREEGDEDDLQSQAGTETEQKLYWSHAAVLLLIDLRQRLQHLFSSTTVSMKQAWKSVADRMSEKGFHFTGPECDRKFRSMKSRHRTIVGCNKTTGSGRSTWRYFSLMEHLTQGDPAVEPLAPVGSLPTTHTQERSSVDGETVAEEPPATAALRRRRSSSGDRMESAITALRRDLLTMHQERMELGTRRVVAEESIAQFLKEKPK